MRQRLWDIAALAVVIAVVIAHVSFLLADERIPQDPGLYYRALPELHAAWLAGDAATLARGVMESSGWYNAMVGLTMAIFGVSTLAFSLFDALWVGLILLGVGLIARQLQGPAAALAAVCLAGSMPVIFLVGRTSWIHTPETALILLAVALWAVDRDLSRWRTAIGMALLGILTITLRPSGLVWTATLVPLLVVQGPRRWGRIVTVGVAWLVALAVPLQNAQKYMTAKAAARDRYATHLPGLVEQLMSNMGTLAMAAVALGLLAGLLRRPRRVEPLAVLMLGWTGISLGLWVLFQAGMDNFPLIAPAVAILGGWGLARLLRPLALLAVPVFALLYIPQWVPSSSVRFLHRIPGLGAYIYGGDMRNHYRVYQRYGWSDVEALQAATCPDRTCRIAIDQGLLEPFVEDIGELELFLVQAENIELISIREGTLPSNLTVDALVEYHCASHSDAQWRERFPDSIDNLAEVMEGLKMLPVWSRQISTACTAIWLTPEGVLADPDALPATGERLYNAILPQHRAEGMKPPMHGDPPLPGLPP